MTLSRIAMLLQMAAALSLVVATSTAAPASPAGSAGWICQAADGTLISAHARQDEARASCTEHARAEAGGIFIVLPGVSEEARASSPQPVVLKSPECQPPKPCPANLPLSGQRGIWSWVAPTRLEKGNIFTDLSHFVMFRQPVGGKPEGFADIDGKATNLIWGMDTRDANACFWIVAVRVNSAAMPSDRSNSICMDAQGRPLPKT